MRDVNTHLRMAFVDGSLRSAVETEPGEYQIVVAPGGGPNDLFDHFCGDGAVLRTEHHADRGVALRIGIGFAHVHPSTFGMDAGGAAGRVIGSRRVNFFCLLSGKRTPSMRSRSTILLRYASRIWADSPICTPRMANVSESPSGSPAKPVSTMVASPSDISGGWTASTVNGPLTRLILRSTSGWSTSSSWSAFAAMQALTSSILARHAARYSSTALFKSAG